MDRPDVRLERAVATAMQNVKGVLRRTFPESGVTVRFDEGRCKIAADAIEEMALDFLHRSHPDYMVKPYTLVGVNSSNGEEWVEHVMAVNPEAAWAVLEGDEDHDSANMRAACFDGHLMVSGVKAPENPLIERG